MADLYKDIQEFHKKFKLEYDGDPRELPHKLFNFRLAFMQEELNEYRDAYWFASAVPKNGKVDLEGQLDALVDLVYVAIGTAYMHGFDFNEAWRRVHEANMKKIRTQRISDSKRASEYDVVKPEGWTSPDLSDLCK